MDKGAAAAALKEYMQTIDPNAQGTDALFEAFQEGIKALLLINRSEHRPDHPRWLHHFKREGGSPLNIIQNYNIETVQCPECKKWILLRRLIMVTKRYRVKCMEAALACSLGQEITCDKCPVSKFPHDTCLDCDGAMLMDAISLIKDLLQENDRLKALILKPVEEANEYTIRGIPS